MRRAAAVKRRREPFRPGTIKYERDDLPDSDSHGAAGAGRYTEADKYIEAGVKLQRNKRYEEALAYYDKAIATGHAPSHAYSNKGTALRNLGKTKEALDYMRRAARFADGEKPRKSHISIYTNLAGILGALGRRDEALDIMEKALDCMKKTKAYDEMFVDLLTRSFAALGEESKAHACWRSGGNMDAWDHYTEGVELMNSGRDAKALACFDRAIGAYPLLVEAHYSKGIAMRHLRRFDEALACFQQASQIEPDDATIYSDVAMELSRMGRDDEAMKCLDTALEKDPDLGIAIYGKGMIQLNNGQYRDAIKYFNRAMKKKSDGLVVRISLGNAHLALGENRKALQYFEQALKLKPNDADALQGKTEAERVLGMRHGRSWSDVVRQR